jgi:beta-phosphoglucomutase-like phosphatase (HAD superfamily)
MGVVSAVIFDFDGLILDTETPIFEALAQVYDSHGHVLERDFWMTVIGRGADYFDPMADLERRLGHGLDREALRADELALRSRLLAVQPVLPGVLDWRAEAVALGLRQGVASSSSRAWVAGHLERLGLAGGWDCIRCGDEVAAAKPAPDVYLAVLECLRLEAGAVLAIEDSAPGVAAAKSAGLRCVAVPSHMTSGSDFSGADLVLDSLAGTTLGEVVERLR